MEKIMLLEFKAKNYKSFKDEFTFSLIPNEKINDLPYSILKKRIGRKIYKGLSSAVIYGANASGKSNIISAIHAFQQIILRGNIENAKVQDPDTAAYQLDMVPNCSIKEAEPVFFSINFITNNLHIQYELETNLSIFSDEKSENRKILNEKLIIDNETIFKRNDTIQDINIGSLTRFFDNKFNDVSEQANILAQKNLSNQELFLTNGFKNIYSKKLVEIIIDWIKNNLVVLYQVNKLSSIPNIKLDKNEIVIDKFINDVGKIIGINSDVLGYLKKDEKLQLCSIFEMASNKIALPIIFFESYGTIRFLNLFPALLNVLQIGGTLIIDEFDASLHPMILMNIIKIFHDEEINKNKAQLVFNTHNPIFLNSNFFRRDEIKFVEKDRNGFSIHYSLSDFNYSKPRNPEEYMNNYFISKYGAIKDIDFSNIFREAINDPNT